MEAVVRLPSTFPTATQRAALGLLTATSRLGFTRRETPLPPVGQTEYRTAVLRIGLPELRIEGLDGRHYRYPPNTVHVTVKNLDTSTTGPDEAISRLADAQLPAPQLTIDGLGCSPDTLLLRCLHDDHFGALRARIEAAFDLPKSMSPTRWVLDRLTYANVVRFDGAGEWPTRVSGDHGMVICRELEVVHTDLYLSPQATTTLGRLPLQQ
jgi:hypothetical protein